MGDMADDAAMDFDDVGFAIEEVIKNVRKTTFLSTPGFQKGFWRGREYKDMEVAHLTNCMGMCERFRNESSDERCARDFNDKMNEIKTYLDSRERSIITQHEFRITEADIIKWAKAYGVKLPKSGAGVYTGARTNQRRIPELFLRWDTSKAVKSK